MAADLTHPVKDGTHRRRSPWKMTTVSIYSTHDSLHLKLYASESLIAQNSLATAISDVDHVAHKYNCAQVQCLIAVFSLFWDLLQKLRWSGEILIRPLNKFFLKLRNNCKIWFESATVGEEVCHTHNKILHLVCTITTVQVQVQVLWQTAHLKITKQELSTLSAQSYKHTVR